MKPIHIYGAGLAGLLAANMLRNYNLGEVRVFEKQESLPNNHHALLRFRGTEFSDAVGIPFREVKVKKAICPDAEKSEIIREPTLAMMNSYSHKVSGLITERSIINTHDAVRYIAPPDLISRIAKNVKIEYGKELTYDSLDEDCIKISTVPLPAMLDIMGASKKHKFNAKEIWTVSIDLPEYVDVYQTVYYPDEKDCIYRASITGRKAIFECVDDLCNSMDFHWYNRILKEHFGIEIQGSWGDAKKNHMQYGKLLRCDPETDSFRQSTIVKLSDSFDLYSLGRFATWRQLLLDDLPKDVRQIMKWIENRYSARLGA